MGNLLLNRPSSASSYVLPYDPSRAVNGNASDPTSRWLCNTSQGWLMVDLGKTYLINRWIVRHMGGIQGWNADSNGAYNMSDFELQGIIDGVDWYDLDTVTGNKIALTNRTFSAQVVQFVRLHVSKGLNINPQLISCMEFEVYECPSADLTDIKVTGGTLDPEFSSNVTNYTVNLGFDTDSFILNPATKDPNATVTMTIEGTAVPSNSSISIDPATSKEVTITVTAGNGTVQNVYKVNAVRASSPYLKSLMTIPSIGTFVKTNYSYSLNLTNSNTFINIIFQTEKTAEVLINGESPTSNTYKIQPIPTDLSCITIVVNSEYGKDFKTYTISVNRS